MHRLTIPVSLQGNKVTVTVKGGLTYQGILATASSEGEFSVALRQAQVVGDPAAAVKPSIVFLARDLVELHAADITLEQRPGDRERDAFKTDTDISGLPGEARRGKELQAWGGGGLGDAGAGNASGGLGGLEDDRTNKSWDQFATNERLYGARTDYHEDIYTTKLDRSGSDYNAREKRAAQLEREILKVCSNVGAGGLSRFGADPSKT